MQGHLSFLPALLPAICIPRALLIMPPFLPPPMATWSQSHPTPPCSSFLPLPSVTLDLPREGRLRAYQEVTAHDSEPLPECAAALSRDRELETSPVSRLALVVNDSLPHKGPQRWCVTSGVSSTFSPKSGIESESLQRVMVESRVSQGRGNTKRGHPGHSQSASDDLAWELGSDPWDMSPRAWGAACSLQHTC